MKNPNNSHGLHTIQGPSNSSAIYIWLFAGQNKMLGWKRIRCRISKYSRMSKFQKC